ncbi:MAG: diguanylate cyclase domain-containing protein [Pseudomonadales bacterium]
MKLPLLRTVAVLVLTGLVVFGIYHVQEREASFSLSKDKINDYLSELERLDGELDRQLLLLDSWNFHNYDGLNAAYSNLKRALAQPPSLPSELTLALAPIEQVLEQKFDLIERLKSQSSLLRNSVNYLPKISQLLYVNIERAVRNEEIEVAFGSELKQYLQQEMLHALTYQLVDRRLGAQRRLMDVSMMSQPFQRDWFNAMKHISFFLNYRKISSELNADIARFGMQQKLVNLNMLFSRYLEGLDRQAERQQLWLLFYIALALLMLGLLGAALRHYRLQHEKRKGQAFTDSLTGLGNRRMLQQKLPQIQEVAQNDGTAVGIIFIDLDGFKAINDLLGHQRGDRLLQDIAGRLRESLRQDDLVVRFGGDEFVIVVSGASRDVLERIARDTLKMCQVSYQHEGQTLNVGASIGISLFPDDTCEMQQLLQMADMAMYRAKEQGKNNYTFYQ